MRVQSAAGFTLIELMVSLVLCSIFIAVAARPLIDGMQAGNHTVAVQSARNETRAALTQLRQDVDAARAPQRTGNNIRSSYSLMLALTTNPNGVNSEDPTLPRTPIDVYDVVTATPTQLLFHADVDASNAGPECVQYSVITTGQYSVTRTLLASTATGACTNRVLSQTSLINRHAITAMTSSSGTNPLTLRYRLQCNRVTATRWAAVGGLCGSVSRGCGLFSPPAGASVTSFARNAIVAVSFDTTALTKRGSSAAQSASSIEAPIPSRNTTDYRRALGCE